jgi:predicted amidophosphoribosyltransferase
MSRPRDKTKNYKDTCKYCGVGLKSGGEMCSNCREKLRLFRQIKRKVKEICERERNNARKTV